MDQDTLVAGGAEGLRTLEQELRAANFPVEAIYLIKRTSVDDENDWVIPVVLSPFILGSDRDLIYEVARLRRNKKLLFIDEQVRIIAVPRDHIEASRVIDYARRMGEPPISIRNVHWNGIYIEYALVADYSRSTAAAA